MASRFSIVPRSRSLVIDSVVTNQHDADQARHDIEHRELLWIVAGVNDELESGNLRLALADRRQVALQIGAERGERRRRIADRAGIGGVGVDKNGGRFAAIDGAIETRWNVDDEQQIAAGETGFRLGLAGERHDIVIAGIFQRSDDGALIFGMIGRQQPGRQVFRIRIDRIAEQEQLHDGDRDDDAQRHRIAPHLDPFFAQKRKEPAERIAFHGAPPFALSM
jgi:hypothetical protein